MKHSKTTRKLDLDGLIGRTKIAYKQGWEATVYTQNPYSYGDLNRHCAWEAGHFDRYGEYK